MLEIETPFKVEILGTGSTGNAVLIVSELINYCRTFKMYGIYLLLIDTVTI